MHKETNKKTRAATAKARQMERAAARNTKRATVAFFGGLV